MLRPGDRAPALELEDLQGCAARAAARDRSRPTLLVFFKVSCPTCQFTLPYIERLVSAASPDAPEILAISQDDAPNTARFQERFGLSMPMLLDPAPRYAASNLYRITHVPSFFLIEPDGTISLSFDGFEKGPLEKVAARCGAPLLAEGERVPSSRPG
jgi:peroxiredoxin